MSSQNLHVKLAGDILQTEVKFAPTWLFLHYNESNTHCNHHYIGNYTNPQKNTNDDNRDASNCMDTSEKRELKLVLTRKLQHQYYTLKYNGLME